MAAADSDEVELALLRLLQPEGAHIESSEAFAASLGVDHTRVVGVMKSLEAEGYVAATPSVSEFLVLSAEAESYIAKGSPEAQLFHALPAEPVDEAGLEALFSKEFVAIAKGKAMKYKWIAREKGAAGRYFRAVAAIERDELVENLKAAQGNSLADAKVVKDLVSRTLIAHAKKTAFRITRGPSYAPVRAVVAADLTKEMLDRCAITADPHSQQRTS